MQIFDFIKRLQVTVLSAIHDLNLAALYCDRLYVMKNGRVVLEGTPEEVLTPEHISEVYGVASTVEVHPLTGKLAITFLPETSRKKAGKSSGKTVLVHKETGRCGVENQRGRKSSMEVSGRVRSYRKKEPSRMGET